MDIKVVGVVFGIVALFALPFSLFSLTNDAVKAETREVKSIFVANVNSMLSQSVESCGTTEPNTALLTNTGAVSGNHFSSCYVVVHNTTNAPGYNLMIQSIDGPQHSSVDDDDNWVYDVDGDGDVDGNDSYANPYGDGIADGDTKLMRVVRENTPPTLPTLGQEYIASTSATIASPAEMDASSSPFRSAWGFAVPKTQSGSATSYFDNNYTTFSSSGGTGHGKYARVPTTASTIRATSVTASNDTTDVYFGASVSPAQVAGTYKGVVIFTAVTNPVLAPAPVLLAIFPDSGLPTGGTNVDIYGAYFMDDATVTIGGTECDSVTFVSSSHLVCSVPAKSIGSYPVMVTTDAGQSNSNIMYTYTETPVNQDTNPYVAGAEGFSGPYMVYGEVALDENGDVAFAEPQGRSVFENVAEAIGDEDYDDLWLAVGGGALLATTLVASSVVFMRKQDS